MQNPGGFNLKSELTSGRSLWVTQVLSFSLTREKSKYEIQETEASPEDSEIFLRVLRFQAAIQGSLRWNFRTPPSSQ